MKRKTYVRFSHPGALVDEYRTQEVTDISELKEQQIEYLKVPKGAFCFHFFDIAVTSEDGIEMKSEPVNISPFYYPGGQILTLEEVKQKMPEEKILISNMECNEWDKVIQTRGGTFKPFTENCVILPDK